MIGCSPGGEPCAPSRRRIAAKWPLWCRASSAWAAGRAVAAARWGRAAADLHRQGRFGAGRGASDQVPHGATGSDMADPAPTVTANSFIKRPGGAAPIGVVAATMVQTGYGEREGQAPRALDIEAPAGTAVAGGVKGRAGLRLPGAAQRRRRRTRSPRPRSANRCPRHTSGAQQQVVVASAIKRDFVEHSKARRRDRDPADEGTIKTEGTACGARRGLHAEVLRHRRAGRAGR
jgi:hypothetical protein